MKASDECYTPAEYIAIARDVLGRIDVDPASNVAAQRVVRAGTFYTVADDGLAQPWRGCVWLNMPYSDPAPWIDRLLASFDAGMVTAALVLVNGRTGAKWFQKLAARAWRCEKRKRIKFWGPGTGHTTGRMDSCFFYLGPEPKRFCAAFAAIGNLVPPVTLAVTSGALCRVCKRSLEGRRADAELCSSRCRQRAYRAAVSAR